ncbi:MAG: hypothetical protein WC011_02585 [Candidatus Paceibacterota bacterium]
MYFRNFLIIFILFFGLFFSLNMDALASSSLYFSKPPIVSEGDRLTIFLRVNSTDQSINAVSGVVSFPENLLRAVSASKESSIINLWTGEPKITRGQISFEGVILNPGFSGNNGLVLKIVFEAKTKGVANLNFTEGSILANDGLGSNVLADLSGTSIRINSFVKPTDTRPIKVVAEEKTEIKTENKLAKLPVIVEASSSIASKEKIYISGKGEPNSLTKIVFKDVSLRSLGEELLTRLQFKKTKLDSILVKNDELGNFQYTSTSNLIAGVYNATPFLVDENESIEKPGLGTQILVSDSKIVKNLIVFINVLGLFIPIVILCVIIYFIPWYSWLRMRILKKKLGLEEEKIELTGINLARQDNLLNQNINEKK